MKLTNTKVLLDYLAKYQYGGILDAHKIKSFNKVPQQDNVRVAEPKRLQPKPVNKDMFGRTVPEPQDRGSISVPYNKSIRESMLSGLNSVDRDGKSEVAKIVTEPLKSGLRLLRPDKYFDNVHSDSDIGGALGSMGMDALNIAPIVAGAAKGLGMLKNIPIRMPLDPNVDYFSEYMKGGDFSPQGYNNFYNNVGKKPLGQVVSDKVGEVMDKPIIPVKKRVLPDNVSFETTKSLGHGSTPGNTTITLKGGDGNDYGYIRTSTEGSDWKYPHMISVDESLQGNRLQDVLYQQAINEAKANGYKGIRSGDHLLQPEKTVKAYDRFNKEMLGQTTTVNGYKHPVVGLTDHQNPNVITDWLEKYKSLPKKLPQKISLNQIIDNTKSLVKPKPKLQEMPEWMRGFGQSPMEGISNPWQDK